MSLKEYVEKALGTDSATLLVNIRRGGDNNAKGSVYEIHFAAYKVCTLTAAGLHEDYLIATQQVAFVDDLMLQRISDNTKINYQAKNSEGAAGRWTNDHEKRFRMQRQIDLDFHKKSSSNQVLLTANVDVVSANTQSIPADMKAWASSEFFPHHENVVALIMGCAELKNALLGVCASSNLSVLDTAFRLVISALHGNGAERRVSDIIGSARYMSKPSVFADSVPAVVSVPPDWLLEKCHTFNGMEVSVESVRLKFGYKGFTTRVRFETAEKNKEELQSTTSAADFMQHLMTVQQVEFADPKEMEAGDGN